MQGETNGALAAMESVRVTSF